MQILNRLYGWYGKRTVLIFLAVVVALVVTGVAVKLLFSPGAPVQTAVEDVPEVTVSSINALGGESLFRVVGTVRAVSEARLQTESGGRVTSVNVTLGQRVAAGTILASLENASQNAALLQAQGAYEAARANAATSESGTESAETNLFSAKTAAVNTYKNAFIAADSAVRNTVDDLFTEPTSALPGFRLNSYGDAPSLNAKRIALETVLDAWASELQDVNAHNIETYLNGAQDDVDQIARFVQTLSEIVARQEASASFTQTEKDTLEAEFLSIRSSLNQTAQALQSAEAAITSAEEALTRAEIAGSEGTVSLAQAQLKSALGSLHAAQANYEKTLVRTPISGVVNALYLTEGTYVSPSQQAAVVANNNALEISTSLSAEDANMVAIGDTVTIDETHSGSIIAIAPAIDPLSGKKEVRISVSDDTGLENGSTVSISFAKSDPAEDSDTSEIVLPLTALKMTANGPVAFEVSPENLLVALPVTLGEIYGDSVVITSGLSSNSQIVVDARGLKEGEKVTITQ